MMCFRLDWAFSVRRALDAVRPSVVLVLETEIWPNFLREAGRRKIPVVFVSGRISDRSFARYNSYLGVFGFFLRPFLRDALSQASAFLMQSEKDADRVRALDAPADRVQVSGNLKYHLRSEEHTSELQSHLTLVSPLLLEKKNITASRRSDPSTQL